MHVLILHTNVPNYFLESIRKGVELGHSFDIVLSKYDRNAPYKNRDEKGIRFYDVKELGKIGFISGKYDAIVSVRWRYWLYLLIILFFKVVVRRVEIFAAIDMPYTGQFKQRILIKISFLLRFMYTNIVTPGKASQEYARMLGFSNPIANFYSSRTVNSVMIDERAYNNKTFLFVGRLVPYKQVDMLCRVFIELQQEEPSLRDWRLDIIGKGPVRIPEHDSIREYGFIANDDIGAHMDRCSAFILPSVLEHWGVVVHEAVSHARPVLLSSGVMSRFDLLEEDVNGYVFHNSETLKAKLLQFSRLSFVEFEAMSKNSLRLSASICAENLWKDINEEVTGRC